MGPLAWSAIVTLLLAPLIGGVLVYPRWRARRLSRRREYDVRLVFPMTTDGARPPRPTAPRRIATVPELGMVREEETDADEIGPSDTGGVAQSVEGRTIRFQRPDPRTMRLLPGRLEVVAGEEGRMEVRFVDLPGEPREITFGRSEGPSLRHVQLRSPTVSRSHARMVWEGDGWVLVNLSQTNPVVVNGVELGGSEERHALSDGDRIDMGEVVFRYHSGS